MVMMGRKELEESTGVGRLENKLDGGVVYLGTVGVAGSQSIEFDTRMEPVSGTKTFHDR